METPEDYIRRQYETTKRIIAMYPGLNVAGKDVLELGCGLGGRAAFIASLGARSVEGVDINRDEIENTQRICRERYPELNGKLSFRAVGEDDSWGRESYDVVILIDAIEHVVSPVSIVRRAYECLRPGGVMYFSSIGWFSAYGSHTGLFPFVNVFFSDLSILNAMRWMLRQPWYRPTRHDSDPPVARWEWLYDLKDRPGEHLNKITINEVRKLLRYSQFSRTHLHLLPLGHNGALRLVTGFMNGLPGLREVSHSYFVATCYK
jgi:SAM-dependent methyltransferase